MAMSDWPDADEAPPTLRSVPLECLPQPDEFVVHSVQYDVERPFSVTVAVSKRMGGPPLLYAPWYHFRRLGVLTPRLRPNDLVTINCDALD